MRWPVVVAILVAGCGGSADLTCPQLADPGNCWATLAAKAAACLPSRAMPATLSSDRSSCAFADASAVHFDTPLPNSTIDLTKLAFDITGNACSARFVDTFHNRMELTVGLDTAVSQLLPDRTFQLQCPDGVTYETSFDTLFTCAPPARAPTDGFDLSANMFMFTISSVSTPGPLFTCAP